MNFAGVVVIAATSLALAPALGAQGTDPLAHLKPGTMLLVQSTVGSGSLGMDRRCRFKQFTANAITCSDPEKRRVLYVLPLPEVESVWRIRRVADKKRILIDALTGALILGGATGFTDDAASSNAGILALVGAGAGALIGCVPKHNDFKHERTELIYQRPAQAGTP